LLDAPLQHRLQTLLPGRTVAPTGQQLEAPVEPLDDLVDLEQRAAPSRQLQRQRQTVEPLAQPGHRRGVAFVQHETGPGRRGALDEEAHGIAAGNRVRRGPLGQGQRRHLQDTLAFNAQGLSTRGQEHQPRAVQEQPVGQGRRGRLHRLAVVQHQQLRPVQQVGQQALDEGRAGGFPPLQRGGQRGPQRRVRLQRRQVDEGHPIGERGAGLPRQLDRQAGLARAAQRNEAEQSGARQGRLGIGQFHRPADEGRAGLGQPRPA
jgi:hypothetical protein